MPREIDLTLRSVDVTLRSVATPKDWWDKLQVVLTASVPIVVAIVSATVLLYQQRVAERESAARRADAQHEIERSDREAERQRVASQATLAAQLLPAITKGSQTERNAALEVLSVVDPNQARQLAELMEQRSSSDAERRFSRRIIETSKQREQLAEYTRQLDLAQQYERYGLQPEAVRAYFAAFEAAPLDLRNRVSATVAQARRQYDSGEIAAALERLKTIFSEYPQ